MTRWNSVTLLVRWVLVLGLCGIFAIPSTAAAHIEFSVRLLGAGTVEGRHIENFVPTNSWSCSSPRSTPAGTQGAQCLAIFGSMTGFRHEEMIPRPLDGWEFDGWETEPCKSDHSANGACSVWLQGCGDGGCSETQWARSTQVARFRDERVPDTSIIEGPDPESVDARGRAQFSFTAGPAGEQEEAPRFQCRLDKDDWRACASPQRYSGLSQGLHTLCVRAVDQYDRIDASPACHTWNLHFAPDADRDGFRAGTTSRDDCNDQNPDVNPGMPEVLNNDLDDNCDGKAEFDRDLDGIRAGFDCDDENSGVNPGMPEVLNNELDDNCDGKSEFDRDADGVRADTDCDDNDARRTPGKFDVPGNGVDENCDGVDVLKVMSISLGVSADWTSSKRYTRLARLTLNGAPRGATAAIRCRSKSCPKKSATLITKRSRQPLKLFKNTRLAAGTVITVTVSHAAHVTAVKRLTIRSGKAPVSSLQQCLPPGNAKPTSC
jgi:hypothetical protein